MKYELKHYIVERAIGKYGKDKQLIVAIEEMSELQKEICKAMRNETPSLNYDQLIEEMADVRLMLYELQVMYKISTEELDVMEDMKLERLYERILKDEWKADKAQ